MAGEQVLVKSNECMIPYFGRHSAKQFIHGKPFRYGFKIWAMCTADGSGVCFEPYCGRSTLIKDRGLGQGPNVVLDLVEKTDLLPGTELFFNSIFTSFPLLEQLSDKQLAGTGTVRQNRLHKVPIMTSKEMDKKDHKRGSTDIVYKDDIVLVNWKDNKPVHVASNKFGAAALNTYRRWSRAEYKALHVIFLKLFSFIFNFPNPE